MLDMLLLTSSQAGDADALQYVQSTAGLLGVRALLRKQVSELQPRSHHTAALATCDLELVTPVIAWYGPMTECHHAQFRAAAWPVQLRCRGQQ